MAGLHFDITGDNTNLLSKIDETKRNIKSMSQSIEKEGGDIEALFSRMSKAAATFGAGFTVKELVSNMIRVRGEFQQLEVAFTTMLGGSISKSNALMSQLVETAAKTPFDLQGVANGARQLLAYGTAAEDVNNTLIRLGNIAAGLSIPLNDLVYLYGTTMTQGRLYTEDLNQFTGRGIPMIRELAKEFGVAETEIKSMVEAGKVGFPEVQKVIENLTNNGGMFYNLMQEQSKTITGQISNIEDAFSTMLNNIGKSSEGIINEALSGVSYLIENYEEVGRQVMALVTAYGAYKAVLMAVAAYQRAITSVSYASEIAELSTLIPQKKASAESDLEQAVASGRLSQAKAEQVIAMRAEATAYVESLRLKAQAATAQYQEANLSLSTAAINMEAAESEVAASNAKYSAALRSKDAKAIERAETELGIAESNRYSAAKALEAARTNANVAYTNASTASKEAETAATILNTSAQTSSVKSTNLLIAAKKRLIAASRALGLSMLANPYVLAAAAVAGLTYTIYKLATAESVSEKATREHREELEKLNEQLDERKSKTEELIRIIQNNNETELSRVRAYEELKKLSPALVEAYSREELSVASLTDVTKLYNEELDKLEYSHLINEVNKWNNAISAAKKLTANRTADENELLHSIFGQGAIKISYLQEQLSLAKDELIEFERLKQKAAEDSKPVELKLVEAKSNREQILNEYNEAKRVLDEEKKKLESIPTYVIPFQIQLRFNNAQSQLNEVDSLISSLQTEKTEPKKTYREAYKEAEANWKAKIKALEDAKNGTRDAYIKAKQEADSAESDFRALGGVTDSSKQKKEFDKQKEAQKEAYESLLSLRRENQEKETALMQDGMEKRLKQIRNEYDAQEAEIEKKSRELSEVNKKAGITNGILTPEQQSEIDRASKLNEENRIKQIEETYKAEASAMRNYLKEYGSFQQQKLAIAEEYAAKIRNAETEGERLSLQAESNRAIQQVEINAIKQQIDWGSVFGEFGTMFREQLQPTVDQLKTIAQSDAFKSSSIEEQQTLYELISKLERTSTVWDSDIFKRLSDDIISYQAAMQGYIEAQDKERVASIALSKVQEKLIEAELSGSDVDVLQQEVDLAKSVLNSASEEVNKFGLQVQQTTSDLQSSSQQAVNMFQTLESGLQGLTSGSLKGVGEGIMSLDKLFGGDLTKDAGNALAKGFQTLLGKDSTAAQSLSKALGSAGTAGAIISAVLGLLDMIAKDGISGIITSLQDTVFGISNKMLDDILSGDTITQPLMNAIGHIGNILDTVTFGGFSSWTSFGNNAKETAEKIASLTASNDALKTSIDGLKEEMQGTNGTKSIKAYNEAIEAQSRYEENLRQILDAQMRYTGSHHSNAYYWNLNANSLRQINSLLGTSLSNTWNDFSRLTADQMNQIRTHLPDIWSEMINQGKYGGERFKEDWENYANQAGEVLEMTNELRETLAQISFDSMRDSFVDSLMDMEKKASDFADDFSEYMMRSLLNFSIGDQLDEQLKKWYESWTDTMNEQEGELTQEQINAYRNQWESFVQEGLNIRDQIADLTGYTGESSANTQQSTSRGYGTEMTHEDAGELSGRFTALYEVGIQILSNISSMQNLTTLADERNILLSEIRNIASLSNGHLENIAGYQKRIWNKISVILDEINNNIKVAL